jgi:dienelactone hydrolase
MKKRNFSMIEYWNRRFENWQPLMTFKGNSGKGWKGWHKEAYNKLLELLGDFPEKVDMISEVEYSVEDGGLIREKIVFDAEEFMSVPCYVLRPKDMKSDRSNAAILCSHGHGEFGKDAVAGIKGSPEHELNIKTHNYNYAEQMANEGFLTIVPDLRVFGERSDKNCVFNNKDKCNVNFIKGAILGVYTLTLNIWDMKCCIDYLETRPEVNPDRIGMMGLSQGGTMTAFTAAIEKRIKAADIIGYVNPWMEFGIKHANFCGSQIVPEVFKYFDTHDIAGLIAPRPLLVEMGIYDQCFYIRDMLKGYEGIRKIYTAAGAEDNLYTDIFPGAHAFSGDKAFCFFKEHL